MEYTTQVERWGPAAPSGAGWPRPILWSMTARRRLRTCRWAVRWARSEPQTP